IESRALLVVRNPVEVARSLMVRNELPGAVGQLLWARYLLDAEAGSKGMPRSLVSYDALLTGWRQVMERVVDELGITLDFSRGDAVDAFLTPQLRHHDLTGSTDELEDFAAALASAVPAGAETAVLTRIGPAEEH